MSSGQGGLPHPSHVPTLTEVIELLSPTPVPEEGLQHAPRPLPPEAGSLAASPIITRSLADTQAQTAWTPMTTVVVPSLDTVKRPHVVSVADLPVLNAVVLDGPSVKAPVTLATNAEQVQHAEQTLATVARQQEAGESGRQPFSEAQLAQRVLGDVQRQIDGMLDFRLREAIGPILARHSEALVRELREELNRTMRDVVARSVAQEMAKLRQR